MSLHDDLNEIRAAMPGPGGKCTACRFIASQPDPGEWDAICADPTVTAMHIERLAERYGGTVRASTWTRHRKGGCKRGQQS